MKGYVCLAVAVPLVGCASGKLDDGFEDAASPMKVDAEAHDTSPAEDVAHVEDVSQPEASQTCSWETLPVATGDMICDSCLSSDCCPLEEPCYNDPECDEFMTCIVEGCDPLDGGLKSACESACASTYPTGANEVSNVETCMDYQCRNDCVAVLDSGL